jgi:hypothetical protein
MALLAKVATDNKESKTPGEPTYRCRLSTRFGTAEKLPGGREQVCSVWSVGIISREQPVGALGDPVSGNTDRATWQPTPVSRGWPVARILGVSHWIFTGRTRVRPRRNFASPAWSRATPFFSSSSAKIE